ncbi:MAG: AAC(3) family N-acetyltransferase [Flammeovirgaceae bacterium]|nr:AAC(3) family N-acetyltransferase [Flammeovirgaceae bacterium]
MSHTKSELQKQIEALGIEKNDTLLIHSSMKAIGEVENGAGGVLDAFIEYLQNGLLIFPTHSWKQIKEENDIFDPQTETSCVGLLSNLFMKRDGVVRSWHPTHSVAAIGEKAIDYVSGEELIGTPCGREGCWGKLYDLKAKILFLGCSPKSNTILHGVEEWNDIPNRLSEQPLAIKIKTPEGKLIDRPLYTHASPIPDISRNYDKIMPALLKKGYAKEGLIGNAHSYLCDVVEMVDLVFLFLQKDPDLFIDEKPVPEGWY